MINQELQALRGALTSLDLTELSLSKLSDLVRLNRSLVEAQNVYADTTTAILKKHKVERQKNGQIDLEKLSKKKRDIIEEEFNKLGNLKAKSVKPLNFLSLADLSHALKKVPMAQWELIDKYLCNERK